MLAALQPGAKHHRRRQRRHLHERSRRACPGRPFCIGAEAAGGAGGVLQVQRTLRLTASTVSGFSQLLDIAEIVEEATARLHPRLAGSTCRTACTRAVAAGLITWQAEARPRTRERGKMPTVPDGDREFDNLDLAARCRATSCHCPRPVRLGLAGCQVVPGDGPWMDGAQATSTEALPFDVIDLTPTTVVAYRPSPSVDRPSTTSRLSAGGRVAVAPGDVLKVRIFEPYEGSIFPTIQRPGADLGAQRVTDEGTINVPYVGTVKVAGLDLTQIEQRIASQLEGQGAGSAGHRRVRRRPHPHRHGVGRREATRAAFRSSKARARWSMPSTAPAVRFKLPAGPARGRRAAQRPGHPDGAVLRSAWPAAISASRRTTRSSCGPTRAIFTVLGAVQKAGNVDLTKPNLTLLEALGQVGGLTDERANKTGVFVFRLGDIQNIPGARARVFRLDLASRCLSLLHSSSECRPETWCMSRMRHFTSTIRS